MRKIQVKTTITKIEEKIIIGLHNWRAKKKDLQMQSISLRLK